MNSHYSQYPLVMSQSLEQIRWDMKQLQAAINRLCPPPRVLVIEDDDNDWFMIQRVLRGFYVDVHRAIDGEEAVVQIKNNKWDIILLDQMMPKLSGEEILRETAGLMQGAKVILVTGLPDSSCIPKSLATGAKMIIPKPLTAETAELFFTPLESKAKP